MKEWAISCIIASFIAGLTKLIIPLKAKNKGINKAFSFLSSIIMILICFSPLLRLWGIKLSMPDFSQIKENEEMILSSASKRTIEIIDAEIRKYYPDEDFYIKSENDENGLIEKIILSGGSEIKDQIAKNIFILYGIKTEVE